MLGMLLSGVDSDLTPSSHQPLLQMSTLSEGPAGRPVRNGPSVLSRTLPLPHGMCDPWPPQVFACFLSPSTQPGLCGVENLLVHLPWYLWHTAVPGTGWDVRVRCGKEHKPIISHRSLQWTMNWPDSARLSLQASAVASRNQPAFSHNCRSSSEPPPGPTGGP